MSLQNVGICLKVAKTFRRTLMSLPSTLKMETVCFSTTLVSTYKSIRHYNPEDQHRFLPQTQKHTWFNKYVNFL
jgi:hypothetical protein